MRILFLTQVLPYPLDAGPKTRAYYVLRFLAQSHEVTLVSFVRSTDTPEAVAHLRQYCAAVHTVPIVRSSARNAGFLLESLVTNQPFIITRDRSAAMRALSAVFRERVTLSWYETKATLSAETSGWLAIASVLSGSDGRAWT